MLRYLLIYKTLISLNFSSWIAYRANFINSILGSMSWGIFSVVSILLLTSRTPSVYGWTRYELLLLSGAYGVVVGMFHVFFSRNFERFSRIIDLGELDQILLKPMDSQFAVSLWSFGFGTLTRVFFSIGIVFYAVHKLDVSISFLNLIGFIILMVVGIVVLYSMWFIMMSTLIWFQRLSNLVDFMFTITGISRYPSEIVKRAPSMIFLILLPFALIVTVPSKVLLSKPFDADILSLLLFAVILFTISRYFWKYALRSYTSASS